MTSTAPIMRWAGSKRKLLPQLRPFTQGIRGKYIEPFVGSAALYFDIAPARAVLGDINHELVVTYHTIVRKPREVFDTATAYQRSKSQYLELRSASPCELGDVERAARFLYLNRYCFNGLYRTNQLGEFNVPYAPSKSGSLPDWRTFARAAKQLGKATIVEQDFESLLRRHVRDGDFVYLDPPYAVANRRIFRQYGPQTFGFEDLERLADCLFALDALGARFLVSYAYCSEAKAVFRHWRQRKVFTQRNIAGFVTSRRTAAELLVSNR